MQQGMRITIQLPNGMWWTVHVLDDAHDGALRTREKLSKLDRALFEHYLTCGTPDRILDEIDELVGIGWSKRVRARKKNLWRLLRAVDKIERECV